MFWWREGKFFVKICNTHTQKNPERKYRCLHVSVVIKNGRCIKTVSKCVCVCFWNIDTIIIDLCILHKCRMECSDKGGNFPKQKEEKSVEMKIILVDVTWRSDKNRLLLCLVLFCLRFSFELFDLWFENRGGQFLNVTLK